jgi:hypothetical protein
VLVLVLLSLRSFFVHVDDEKFERKLQIFNLCCDFGELLICWFHYFFPAEENILILSYIQTGSIMVNIVLSLIQLVKDFKHRLKKMFQKIQLRRQRSRSAKSWSKLRAVARMINPISQASSSRKGGSEVSDEEDDQKPLAPIGPLSVSRPIQLVPISRTANAFHNGPDGTTTVPLGPPPMNPLSFISTASFRSKPIDAGRSGGTGLPPKLQFSAAVKNVIVVCTLNFFVHQICQFHIFTPCVFLSNTITGSSQKETSSADFWIEEMNQIDRREYELRV